MLYSITRTFVEVPGRVLSDCSCLQPRNKPKGPGLSILRPFVVGLSPSINSHPRWSLSLGPAILKSST